MLFSIALLFAAYALIFLFVRSRLLAAEYSEKQVVITNENLRKSRTDRIYNNRIRTVDAYRYVNANKQLREHSSYVSPLDLLPYPEYYANKDDQQAIFRRLVTRRLAVNNTAVAYEMNNRFRTTFLVTAVPRISWNRTILAMAYPLIVVIIAFLLKDSAIQLYFDDESNCYSKSWWLPKEIPLPVSALLSCTVIVGALLHCREGILRSGRNI